MSVLQMLLWLHTVLQAAIDVAQNYTPGAQDCLFPRSPLPGIYTCIPTGPHEQSSFKADHDVEKADWETHILGYVASLQVRFLLCCLFLNLFLFDCLGPHIAVLGITPGSQLQDLLMGLKGPYVMLKIVSRLTRFKASTLSTVIIYLWTQDRFLKNVFY